MTQTAYTDDRMDPEKATRAAAHHLRDLYNEFGDWYLAIAAYNCGPQVVEKAVERTGYADFWELRSRGVLPAETTNYVPIILAMTIMEKNAAEYGLDNLQAGSRTGLRYRATFRSSQPGSGVRYHRYARIPRSPLSTRPSSTTSPRQDFALHVPKGSGAELQPPSNAFRPSIALPGACTRCRRGKHWRPSASDSVSTPPAWHPPTTSRPRKPPKAMGLDPGRGASPTCSSGAYIAARRTAGSPAPARPRARLPPRTRRLIQPHTPRPIRLLIPPARPSPPPRSPSSLAHAASR